MSDIPHTRLPVQPCPECDHPLDAHASVDEHVPPRPGDYCVCLECAAILRFDPRLKLSAVADLDAEEPDDDIKFVLRRAQQHVRQRGRYE